MTKRRIAALLAAALLAAGAAGCRARHAYRTVDGVMLGTRLHLIADTPAEAQELYAAAMRLDAEAKRSMSLFDPQSLLNRLNRNETDTIDAHIRRNLLLADSVARLSDGAYDITVAPLVPRRRRMSIRCSPSSASTRSASRAAGSARPTRACSST